jgi:hypothetical protein
LTRLPAFCFLLPPGPSHLPWPRIHQTTCADDIKIAVSRPLRLRPARAFVVFQRQLHVATIGLQPTAKSFVSFAPEPTGWFFEPAWSFDALIVADFALQRTSCHGPLVQRLGHGPSPQVGAGASIARKASCRICE